MDPNKENEEKRCGSSKIPVLIRSLPKSGRSQPKLQQQRLLKTVERGPLNTLAFQRVNQDLAGPSYSETRCIPRFVINEKYLQKSDRETRNPLKALPSENQNVGHSSTSDNYSIAKRVIPHLSTAQNNFKSLAGPANSAKEIIRPVNSGNVVTKSDSKIPGLSHLQQEKSNAKGPVPLTVNSGLGIIGFNPCLAGPSSLKEDCSLQKNTEICKVDGMIAAFKKDRILACALDKNNFFTPPLELGSVKKVKRSLKRPHSRGLQCLPRVDVDLTNENRSEQKIQINDTEKNDKVAFSAVIDKITHWYTTDALLYLLHSERKPLGSNIPDDCRSCIINYMTQVNGSTGQPGVVQSATWYIDSMFLNPEVSEYRLTAAACVWIAGKFHAGPMHGMRIVKRSNNAFTVQDLALAERRVLNVLKYPIQPVIPQDFIPYLSWWCDPEPGMIESAATFLCLCGLTVSKSIGQEYASVVAVASVKTALILLKLKEQEKRLEECPVYHSAKKQADIAAVCVVLRESLHKMTAVNYEYKVALSHYSQKPYCIAPELAYANRHVDR